MDVDGTHLQGGVGRWKNEGGASQSLLASIQGPYIISMLCVYYVEIPASVSPRLLTLTYTFNMTFFITQMN